LGLGYRLGYGLGYRLGLGLGLGLRVRGRCAAYLASEEEARPELGAVRLGLGGTERGAVRGAGAYAVERVRAEAVRVGPPAGDVRLVRVGVGGQGWGESYG
jgi:hypothetical protein